ncbi:hypothetical protein [Gordonia alkanivorans]|uniref:hypothetical protein n=1 Tax=Gordonia alkanivorans TaxID=84096 RepID=UPI0024B6EF0A|nr:hypothetical protein [Gordonia alkanivorans]MDJ0010123.1 hypothetical protein [Gordonia alkanivorans]MDJ0495687.1 hypothetical protein [Gordonia alkanivorans]
MTTPRTTTLHYIWWLDGNMWRHYLCETRYAAREVEGVLRILGHQHVQICEGTPE